MNQPNESGSITMLVLIICTFLVIFLLSVISTISSHQISQEKAFTKITQNYQIIESDMEQAYLKAIY